MDANGDGQCNTAEFTSQWMKFGSKQSFLGNLAIPG